MVALLVGSGGDLGAAKFTIGDTVTVTANLNVRTGPGLSYPEITDPDYPGYAPAGTIGGVLSGPSSANGYIWWEVDYGPGLYSGWSVENWLEMHTGGYPGAQWVPAHPNGYTVSDRESTYDIRYIVIHTAEGSYQGTIGWFQNPAAGTSTHYVISKTGDITAMVSDEDIAHHAGNWEYNKHSVGIEHEGFVNDPTSYTEAMYQASAGLVRWLAQEYDIQLVH